MRIRMTGFPGKGAAGTPDDEGGFDVKRLYVLAGLAVLGLVALTATAGEQEMPAGHKLFLEMKCNMCHGVSTVDIEAKTKSEKMKGPELVGLGEDWDAKDLAGYMKKEVPDQDGNQHKKDFKGSDEELQALVDWLLEQKAEG